MWLRLRYVLLILLFGWDVVVAENDRVTLNGVLGDKAVVMINGKPEIYSAGDSKNGIMLIKVNEESAVFEIRGKKTTLHMVKAFSKSSLLAKEIAAMDDAKSHFVYIKLIFQTWNTMTYEIDYFYDGSFGPYATLSAKPYFLGSTAGYWIHPYTKAKEGRHTITLTIKTNEQATGAYLSDEILFEMLWGDEKNRGVAAKRRVKVIKEWTQQLPQS